MTAQKLKVGIVGAGWWAVSNHLPCLISRSDVEIVAICRKGQEELRQVQQAFGIPHAFEDFGQMLDQVDMDAVFICTPHQLHAEQACMALEHGLHVLVEKPISTNAAEARRLERTVAKTGKIALVPFGWNFRHYAKAATDWVAAGRIGKVKHVSGAMASPMGDLMSGDDMPGTETEMFRPAPETWSDPITGGYAWGQLVHLLALIHRIVPADPISVTAMTDRTDTQADLYNAVTVRNSDGSTMALSGSATLPSGSEFQIDIRIFGTMGVVLLDVERERLQLISSDGQIEDHPIKPGDGAYSCVAPVNHFIDLCFGHVEENPATVTLARRGCEIVDAMHHFVEQGTVAFIGETK